MYKIKRGAHGEVTRYMYCTSTRDVGGFKQIEGVDFNETFDSVVKPMSFKTRSRKAG